MDIKKTKLRWNDFEDYSKCKMYDEMDKPELIKYFKRNQKVIAFFVLFLLVTIVFFSVFSLVTEIDLRQHEKDSISELKAQYGTAICQAAKLGDYGYSFLANNNQLFVECEKGNYRVKLED